MTHSSFNFTAYVLFKVDTADLNTSTWCAERNTESSCRERNTMCRSPVDFHFWDKTQVLASTHTSRGVECLCECRSINQTGIASMVKSGRRGLQHSLSLLPVVPTLSCVSCTPRLWRICTHCLWRHLYTPSLAPFVHPVSGAICTHWPLPCLHFLVLYSSLYCFLTFSPVFIFPYIMLNFVKIVNDYHSHLFQLLSPPPQPHSGVCIGLLLFPEITTHSFLHVLPHPLDLAFSSFVFLPLQLCGPWQTGSEYIGFQATKGTHSH